MDFDTIPEELITPPERRLTKTLITRKPHASSLGVTLFFLLTVIFTSQFYWIDPLQWAEFMPAVQSKVFVDGQWWRVFTAILIHGDLGHLASNLYMLGIFSFFVYGYFGFYVYPIYTFLGAGFVNLIAISTYAPNVRLLGASGLVYLLGGFWLTLYLFIQRQHKVSSRIMRVMGMALMVFFPTSFEATTSYRTHFIGFAVGAIMALFYFIKNKKKIREKETYQHFGLKFKDWN